MDCVVGKLSLRTVSHRGERGDSLGLLERAARAALQTAAAEVADEYLIIERIDVHLRLLVSGDESPIDAIKRHLPRKIHAHLAEARAQSGTHWIRDGVAWFASEAVAFGYYVEASVTGKAAQWPCRGLSRFGADLNAAIQNQRERRGTFWADVLAALASGAHFPSVVSALEPHAEAILQAILAAGDGDLDGLPDSIWSDLLREHSGLSSSLDHQPHPDFEALAAAAILFKLWPPLRGVGVSRDALRRRLNETSRPERLISSAGGLIYWAKLYHELGFDSAFASPAQRGPARWAIARALEDAAVPASDPMFALFAGESPGPLLMESKLSEIDPERLIELALREVRSILDGAEVRVSVFGAGMVAVAKGGVVVDVQYEHQGEEMLQLLVKRFRARVGTSPGAVSSHERVPDADLDAVAEFDVPALPLSWRAAAVIVASVMRFRLQRAGTDVGIERTRRWPATIVARKRVELGRAYVRRIGDGRWLSERVAMAEATFEVAAI